MKQPGQLTEASSTPRIFGNGGADATLWRLHGWVNTVRLHGKLVFVDLRDFSGIVQCVGRNMMQDLNAEDVVEITGRIVKRPEHLVNPDMATGTVEVVVESCTVLNKCKELPIPIDGDGRDINEEMRLRFRYLDLRRRRMQRNLTIRAQVYKCIHQILGECSVTKFTQIETPLLTKSTKEGARDFVVPSRLQPGKFYALPQSPQQYKQLLMTAGFQGYYQIARCVRDESLRHDRGFEFTQLDVEMAFPEEWRIFHHISDVVRFCCSKTGRKCNDQTDSRYDLLDGCRSCFPVLTHAEAMEMYGTDKPDIRTPQEKAENLLAFCWVTRFPMYKKVVTAEDRLDAKGDYTFMHNPFSMPIAEHLEWHMQGINLERVQAYQYDLVCNGYEIGSGSIRAHRREILEATFRNMGYNQPDTLDSVGHMLEAFDLGTPPHGGIALGIDRLVMLLCGESSLKEVIPFPMTGSGRTSVMDAPSGIPQELRDELGINTEADSGPGN